MSREILSVRKDAVDLKELLFKGTVFRQGELWSALPREVVSNPSGADSVIFELTRSTQVLKPSLIQVWFHATRPETLTLTVTPGFAVLCYGWMRGWEVSWISGALALFGALLLQVAVNALNDVEDHLRLLDLIGKRGRNHGVIQKGWLSASRLQVLGYVAFGAGILLGLPVVIQHPSLLLGVGGLGTFGVIAYSNRPFEMKYRALGEFLIFFLMGPLISIGFSEALFGKVNLAIGILGSFFGILAFGIFLGNNLKGFNSLVSKLGFGRSRHILSAAYGAAFLILGLGVVLGELPSVAAAAAVLMSPFVFRLLKNVYRASGPISPLLIPVKQNATRIHFFMGVGLCLGFLLSRLL